MVVGDGAGAAHGQAGRQGQAGPGGWAEELPAGQPAAHGLKKRRGLLSRRALLQGAAGAAALGGAGALGAAFGSGPRAWVGITAAGAQPARSSASVATATRGVAPAAAETERSFLSRPDLAPPRLQMSLLSRDPEAGYLLLTPSAIPSARGVDAASQLAAGLGQPGVMIVDERGQVVWFQPTTGLATDLQVQSYRGDPVLTYWEGTIEAGIGDGTGYVLDSSYQPVAAVKGGNGVQTDLHELQLTPQNTALITAYAKRAADLTAVGGKSNGYVHDSVVQEIDLATGRVLLDWRSLDHVPVTESHQPYAAGIYDYFHVNSVCLYGDNELLVSSRNTWALYRIDRKTGAVLARINGKRSDYKMGAGAGFFWQHHARSLPGGLLTVFDDGAAPAEEPRSRGLVLGIDDTTRTVHLVRAFTHPANLLTPYEGSVQLLPGGGAFIGWGAQPYFSQFAADGTLQLDGRFPTNDQSYRAFRSPWTGSPKAPPDVHVAEDGLGQTVVSVSWNGATDVASWQVRGGVAASRLEVVATVPKAGFETTITCREAGKVLAVAALDARGRQIGVSAPKAV